MNLAEVYVDLYTFKHRKALKADLDLNPRHTFNFCLPLGLDVCKPEVTAAPASQEYREGARSGSTHTARCKAQVSRGPRGRATTGHHCPLVAAVPRHGTPGRAAQGRCSLVLACSSTGRLCPGVPSCVTQGDSCRNNGTAHMRGQMAYPLKTQRSCKVLG